MIVSQYSYHSPSVTDMRSPALCVQTSWACCCKMLVASCRVLQQVDVLPSLPVFAVNSRQISRTSPPPVCALVDIAPRYARGWRSFDMSFTVHRLLYCSTTTKSAESYSSDPTIFGFSFSGFIDLLLLQPFRPKAVDFIGIFLSRREISEWSGGEVVCTSLGLTTLGKF